MSRQGRTCAGKRGGRKSRPGDIAGAMRDTAARARFGRSARPVDRIGPATAGEGPARLVASELRLLLIQLTDSAMGESPSNGDGPACDVSRPTGAARAPCRREATDQDSPGRTAPAVVRGRARLTALVVASRRPDGRIIRHVLGRALPAIAALFLLAGCGSGANDPESAACPNPTTTFGQRSDLFDH
jgi:hypothetical protein